VGAVQRGAPQSRLEEVLAQIARRDAEDRVAVAHRRRWRLARAKARRLSSHSTMWLGERVSVSGDEGGV
jgi:hypothetical protein